MGRVLLPHEQIKGMCLLKLTTRHANTNFCGEPHIELDEVMTVEMSSTHTQSVAVDQIKEKKQTAHAIMQGSKPSTCVHTCVYTYTCSTCILSPLGNVPSMGGFLVGEA